VSAGESLVGLPERLRQRLADLETVARAAIERSGTADWAANPYGNVMPADPRGNDWLAVAPYAGDLGDVGVHIAAHDPAHVLRTIQAHRRLLDRHSPRPLMNNDGVRVVEMQCSACVAVDEIDWFNDEIAYETYPCDDVRDLASIYFPEGTEP
jgi:uncharacterized protein DUF6221